MILLWGSLNDAPLRDVAHALTRRRATFTIADPEAARPPVVLERRFDTLSALLSIDGELIDLDDVNAMYVRPAGGNHQHPLDQTLHDWADIVEARTVINRPSAMTANASKPFQLRWIERHGFDVPDTLITTNIDALQAFKRRHGTIIYKSISGVRSIVSRLGEDGDLTNLRHCPTQFQQYVPGVDVRVHVVGGAVFACEITCSADDYRYAKGSVPSVRAVSLPIDVETRSRGMAVEMGLMAAGIDFRRTPDGLWYCLEVNPSPGFSYFAALTSQPIADALAGLLVERT
jgi:glutathione synthase/RimK-type ligase-like ATP-grasp enzyme